jgi:hypothetical protein
MDRFCVEAGLENPKCYTLEKFKFQSEEPIFDILLDVFKSELPQDLKQETGCDGKPLFISESSIDIVPSETSARFSLILNPLGDVPTYPESPVYRSVDYNFEFILTVTNDVPNCATWELLKFKNVVESILIGAEFAIDGYDSVYLEPRGFNYYPTGIDDASGKYYRQGAYRFTVTVKQEKIN